MDQDKIKAQLTAAVGQANEMLANLEKVKGEKGKQFGTLTRNLVNLHQLAGMFGDHCGNLLQVCPEAFPEAMRLVTITTSAISTALYDLREAQGLSEADFHECMALAGKVAATASIRVSDDTPPPPAMPDDNAPVTPSALKALKDTLDGMTGGDHA